MFHRYIVLQLNDILNLIVRCYELTILWLNLLKMKLELIGLCNLMIEYNISEINNRTEHFSTKFNFKSKNNMMKFEFKFFVYSFDPWFPRIFKIIFSSSSASFIFLKLRWNTDNTVNLKENIFQSKENIFQLKEKLN